MTLMKNVIMNIKFYVIGIFGMLLTKISVAGTIDTSGQEPFEQCAYCHEYDGNSLMQAYPRLAGQQKMYLIKQLNDFKSGKRKSPMQATAELLTDNDIKSVADYFSKQVLKNTKVKLKSDFSDARVLFNQGIEKRGLMACSSCHGETGEGAGVIPRISGQHEDYLVKQLLAFKARTRKNDEAGFMRDIAKNLTDREIRTLSAYLASGNVGKMN